MPFFFPATGMIYLIPAMILAMYAQHKVQSTFNKYLQVPGIKRYSGGEAAREILNSQGLYDVPVELVGGRLSDHYDPRKRALRLSQDVYRSPSLAALGVAAHEVGHAIQHDRAYFPLVFRNSLFPIARFGSQMAWILVLLGFFMQLVQLIDIGIYLFSAAVLFQVVTLPVEYNASSRAIRLLVDGNFITSEEVGKTRKVLNAAALTYVAAMAVAVAQLLRLVLLRRRS